ncbi:peptidoglycan DD-metalloendopeptidase family protein [Candidatus Dojkabacteria bacterium]|nr:peptidoglycan DD-metalloendopeptidase family protein [Candidatus Dojkabacteria bacterium]
MGNQKNPIISKLETQLTETKESILKKDNIITALRDRINKIVESNQDLSNEFNQLQTKVLGLTTIKKQAYPFQVPSNGFIGSYVGGYGTNMSGMRHLGIDIWTSMNNGGKVAGGIGNPVYSACDGFVENIEPKNAAVIIKCNKISKDYQVPEYDVYTYYGHMGDSTTKNLFIEINKGDKVKMGQYLGFQGNLSSFYPEMENVHLHFSIFAGYAETDPQKGALNPCLYIGGDCSKKGSEFQTGLETGQ